LVQVGYVCVVDLDIGANKSDICAIKGREFFGSTEFVAASHGQPSASPSRPSQRWPRRRCAGELAMNRDVVDARDGRASSHPVRQAYL